MISRRQFLKAGALFVPASYARGQVVGFNPFVPSSAANGANLLTGIISYWKMSESTGSTRVDSVGSNNLTDVTSGVALNSGGIVGGGADFSSIGPTGMLSHADNSDLGIGSGKSFTFSAWFKPSASVVSKVILSKWGSAGSQDYALAFDSVNQIVVASVMPISGSQVNVSSNRGTNTSWWHVAFGYDDSLSELWIQINAGVRYRVACLGVKKTSASFAVGNYTGGAENFVGIIDEVGMWGRSLSFGEIVQLYASGAANQYPFTGSPGAAGNQISHIVSTFITTATYTNAGVPIGDTLAVALDTFYSGLVSNSLSAKYICLFPVQVKGRGWGITPLIFSGTGTIGGTLGSGAWVTNGLKGNGSQYFDVGVLGTDLSINDAGYSIYGYDLISAATQYDFGYTDNAGANMFAAKLKESNTLKSYIEDVASLVSVATPGNGFFSGNRTNSTTHKVYFANSSNSPAQIGSTNSTANGGVLQAQKIILGAVYAYEGPSIFAASANTYSYVAVHKGWSSTDFANEYALVQALLTSFGAGYI